MNRSVERLSRVLKWIGWKNKLIYIGANGLMLIGCSLETVTPPISIMPVLLEEGEIE